MMYYLGFPFRLLLGGLRAVSELFEWFVISLGGLGARPWWKTVLLLPFLIPYWMVWAFFTVLSYPFSLNRLEPERRLNVYYGIPAIVALLFTLGTLGYSLISWQQINGRYRGEMQRAMVQKDFKTATILGGRLASQRKAEPSLLFEYAIALARNGESTRSEAILSELAPLDRPGFGPAHFLKAQILAQEIAASSSDKALTQLRWHLENCNDEYSEEAQRLWAVYFVTVGQPDQAVKFVERASVVNPRLHLSLANLYADLGSKPGETRALRAAEQHLRKLLADDPLSLQDRKQLAVTLVRLNKSVEAEELILKGVEIHKNAEMMRSAAQYYMLQYEINVREFPDDLTTQFDNLERAMHFDMSLPDIYEHMVRLYERAEDAPEAKKIKERLENMLVEGQSPALVHFALSSLYQIDGDSTLVERHLRQAYQLNPNVPMVMNNLAWMFAHKEEPNLHQALEMAQTAVQMQPNDPVFRDTLATILMKQERFEEAIANFEAILGRAKNKKEIHDKLATIYRKLEMKDLARMHDAKAREVEEDELAKTP
jgi:tetratricopeptide (TPR) repeat protein